MTNNSLISQESLAALYKIPTPTILDALWVKGWPQGYVRGARSLVPGTKMTGRAVTLRFVPFRPDLLQEKPKKEQSAEYVAFELCGPSEVLVVDAMDWTYSSIGGDIKFYRLHQRGAAGLVTDGAVRDSAILKEYSLKVFCATTTAKQGPAEMLPWGVNEVIQCGGVLVRPGDAIVGDDDGVVVIPSDLVEEVTQIAIDREEKEAIIKKELDGNDISPGKYYPFNEETEKLVDRAKQEKG